ncbi:hypothetical protein BKA67DRAFT_547624 [Truncatella angustata]|uniref:Uncharacterized protein n=1 Tax=Truncatella angustata TaxID=152316 RepID=A0A9P8UYF5_9PEZI|nr:uncharacterized protein BKA67DRAFT_547624 [Truncatella angustata]KAH6660321.1 hypothetical protein BKA67DRAFT_547624 [Truncatella angustata]
MQVPQPTSILLITRGSVTVCFLLIELLYHSSVLLIVRRWDTLEYTVLRIFSMILSLLQHGIIRNVVWAWWLFELFCD